MGESHDQGTLLLRTILEEKSWAALEDNGIKDSDFYDDAKQVLRQMRKYHLDYSEFPEKEVLELKIKSNCVGMHDFELPSVVDKQAALDIFLEDKSFRDFNFMLKTAKDIRNQEGVQSAWDYVQNNSHNNIVAGNNRVISYSDTYEQRLERHNKLKWESSNHVPSPWPYFNSWASGGWEKSGSAHNLIGQSGAGKTWGGVVAALNAAFNHDMRVLFMSMENGVDSIENRMDAYYSKVPYGKLRQGRLEFRSYDQYFHKMKSLADKKGDIFIDSSGENSSDKKTVAEILAMSKKYGVDLVVVDGAYLVEPTHKGNNQREGLSVLSYDFQHACKSQEDTAWLLSLQLSPDVKAGPAKEMSMNIRNCKEFYIVGATSLTLTANHEDRLAQRIKMSLGKDRESAGIQMSQGDSFYIHDDKIEMSFEEFDIEEYTDAEFQGLV